MNAKFHAVAVRLNIARPLCEILLGSNHAAAHRMSVGVVFMSAGVFIAKAAHGIHFEVLAMAVDCIGYGVHGLGLTPFIEWLAERVKKEAEEKAEGDKH